ncbi:MAG: sigma-70 family RNA polymerase sigma factor [Ignavibacteriales bacterium]|nr:sigma-70 family RNA polymerase sigma factor [Ignavibacteriales bacterium]
MAQTNTLLEEKTLQTKTKPSDSELVTAFQRGDIVGFNELVRRYQEKVYWIARRIVIDHDDADDVTQDVFVKVYGALKNFRQESEFYTWIYRITTNISLNHIRGKKVKQFFRIDDESEDAQAIEIKDESSLPDAMLEQKEMKTMIEKAVEKLPKQQKLVFIMRYYDELSYDEISKQLKISIGGLKANYFHALKKIQKYLEYAMQ